MPTLSKTSGRVRVSRTHSKRPVDCIAAGVPCQRLVEPLQEEGPGSQGKDLDSFSEFARAPCKNLDGRLVYVRRVYPDFSLNSKGRDWQGTVLSVDSWGKCGYGVSWRVLRQPVFRTRPTPTSVCTLSRISWNSMSPERRTVFLVRPEVAAGILRRAKRRGRTLQEYTYERALESAATRLVGGKKTTVQPQVDVGSTPGNSEGSD